MKRFARKRMCCFISLLVLLLFSDLFSQIFIEHLRDEYGIIHKGTIDGLFKGQEFDLNRTFDASMNSLDKIVGKVRIEKISKHYAAVILVNNFKEQIKIGDYILYKSSNHSLKIKGKKRRRDENEFDSHVTISLGWGKYSMTSSSNNIENNYILPFRLMWWKEINRYSQPTSAAFIGYQKVKAKALDGQNITNDFNASAIEIGAMHDVFKTQYYPLVQCGTLFYTNANMSKIGDASYVMGFYVGFTGFIPFQPIFLQYELNYHILGDFYFDQFTKDNGTVIYLQGLQFALSLHYMF